MMAGQRGPFHGPNEPPRSSRVIADSWRAYTGATGFRQCCPVPHLGSFETAQFAGIYQFSSRFRLRGWRMRGRALDRELADISDP